MNTYIALSAILAIVLYIPLCVQIAKHEIEQNLATWLLWATLDILIAVSLIVQSGNYILVSTFALGSSCVCVFITKSGKFAWTTFETTITIMVVMCVIAWMISGPKLATILSSFAMSIASVPQLRDAYRDPWSAPFGVYTGYLVANILSVVGAKNWSVQEVFFPANAAVCCAIFVLVTSRKFWLQKPVKSIDFSDLSRYRFS